MKNITLAILLLLHFSGCEKVIDLDYKGNSSALVIEGNITDQPGPYYVKITQSIGLSDTKSYPTIDDASVTISDNTGHSEILLSLGNGTYRTATIEGVSGRTYALTVVTGSQTYTSQSTMPSRVSLDAIKVDEVAFAGDIERSLIPVYQDPIAEGNRYRFVLSINDKLVNQQLVLNDLVRNGLVNTAKLEINDDDIDLEPETKVTITMQCIDTAVSMYYTSLALMADSGPGGGTTPNNPPGNISNGALGVFSAHTMETKSITIP